MKLKTPPRCGCGRRMKAYGDGQYWCPGFHAPKTEDVVIPPLEAFVSTHDWVQGKR